MTIDDCIRDVVGYEGKYKINIVGESINGNAQDIYRCLCGKTKTHKKYHYEVVV